VLNGHII